MATFSWFLIWNSNFIWMKHIVTNINRRGPVSWQKTKTKTSCWTTAKCGSLLFCEKKPLRRSGAKRTYCHRRHNFVTSPRRIDFSAFPNSTYIFLKLTSKRVPLIYMKCSSGEILSTRNFMRCSCDSVYEQTTKNSVIQILELKGKNGMSVGSRMWQKLTNKIHPWKWRMLHPEN